jgi:hypothetical protein
MKDISVAALLGTICLSTSVLTGCTPPYPTHKHMQAPGGIVRNLPDPSTVIPAISRRDEVLRAFKEVDTGVSSQWFFWGRWESSSAAMSVVTDSGVERDPIWSSKNFLVEFDDAGTVIRTSTLSDNRIVSELERVLAEHPQSTEAESAPVVLLGGFLHPESIGAKPILCYPAQRLTSQRRATDIACPISACQREGSPSASMLPLEERVPQRLHSFSSHSGLPVRRLSVLAFL